MRDKSHSEQIKRWAEFVKNNSNWKKELNSFIDSQLIKANNIYKQLSQTPEGRKKILKLRRINQ